MLDNMERSDYIPYLFKAKKWTGGKEIYRVWDDMLSEYNDDVLKETIIKALGIDGNINATDLRRWAKSYSEQEKYVYREDVERIEVKRFCFWCLKEQAFDTTYGNWYCKVCNARYNQEKSDKAKELFMHGKLDYIKKCRNRILDNMGDFEMLDKYKAEMLKLKKKDDIYQYTI